MLDFRQITPFYLEYRLLKHKITIRFKTLAAIGPLGPLLLRLCPSPQTKVENII